MAFTMELELPKKEEVVEELQVDKEIKADILDAARKQVTELLATDLANVEGRRSVSQVIEGYGMEEAKRISKTNKLLTVKVSDLESQGGESRVVAESLSRLNDTLKGLDPQGIDFTRRGLIGAVMNPVRKYFKKYEKSDKVISDILEGLAKGKTILKNDNVTLELEQQTIRETTKNLGKQIEMGMAMDTLLEQEVSKLRALSDDEDRVKFIEEEVLYPLRQRVLDLQTVQDVNYQAYFSIEVSRKNNLELIRAVDRSQLLTKTALQTAVQLANSLYHSRMVLDSVNSVRSTTNALILHTSEMIKSQGVEIQTQAAEAMLNPEDLRTAFQNAFSALDDISNYKAQALPKLKAIMLEFKEMADDGEKRVQRMENGMDVV